MERVRASIKDKVAVVGTGLSKFGENYTLTYHDMVIDAAFAAMEDAGLSAKDIDAAWLGTSYPDESGLEGNSGASLAEPLGLYPKPVTRVANYCATGADAIRNGAIAVVSGLYDYVLIVGVEKMREVPSRGTLLARHVLKTHPLLCKGRTMPGLFSLVANRYFETYSSYDPRKTLSSVAIKNHFNGSLNPKAHFQRVVTEQEVSASPLVADPLRILDCCPTTDGAAAVVLTSRDIAEKQGHDYVLIKGIGMSTAEGWYSLHFNPEMDFTSFRASRDAAQAAYDEAGIKDPSKEIGVVELHDAFTSAELVDTEDLRLFGRGEGGRMALEGVTSLHGEIPVNPSGGLKSFGHPVGATGTRMAVEIVNQIRGRCGARQVRSPKMGLLHNLGGPGCLGIVMVFGR